MATSGVRGRKLAILLCCAAAAGGMPVVWSGWDELKAWYGLRQYFDATGRNAQGYSEYRHRATGITFVRLPAGRFLMGSPEDEYGGEECERPRHEVSVDSFLIAKYEVSQSEWERNTGRVPSHFRGHDLPVEMVSWFDCGGFCSKNGLDLPTEAQWEYACRGNTETAFAFGRSISPNLANYNGKDTPDAPSKGASRNRTVPVASFAPNPFGLHNMHGNVAEWCMDAVDWEFYSKTSAQERNPVCSDGEPVSAGCYTPKDATPYRIARGGDFGHWAIGIRSAKRAGVVPGARLKDVGFRPVFNLSGSQ